ncbi:MAG: zinc-dependent metalloprotease [Candidatus Sumerlaeota bacterium]|nr:zinc-dependent metalloprotease [Candidatus Sumerlaeota bacterium]
MMAKIRLMALALALSSALVSCSFLARIGQRQKGAGSEMEGGATTATASQASRVRSKGGSPSAEARTTSSGAAYSSMQPGASGQPGGAAPGGGERSKLKPFADVIKDYKEIKGLFTFYEDKDEGKVFMEIRPDQLEKMRLCSVSRAAGDGTFAHSVAMMGNYPFMLRRVGQQIQMIEKNVGFRADKSAAISRVMERDLSDSLLASARIESAPHPERQSILVNAASFFIQDVGGIGNQLKEYKLDPMNSYFSRIQSFPKNTEVEVTLYFRGEKGINSPTLADDRSFRHIYHYSLSEMQQSSYKPREADERVGYFVTQFQDYTSVMRDQPYVRYIRRWNLQKAESHFQLSPPREPIVFWLENTIPIEYRDTVREGVLLWNKAFERIGYKDAIVVKQMPDDADWQAEDIRYNVIRWFVAPGVGIAVGPSQANPLTGELYAADVRISADFVRSMFREYEEIAHPVSAVPGAGAGQEFAMDNYGELLAREASFGWSVLAARADVTSASHISLERYIHDYLVQLICHEVGHTLGLRHNFKASSAYSLEQLHDPEFTKQNGISASVMDYLPANIAAEGKRQGQYFQTTLGPYDYWAIAYAYSEPDASKGEKEEEMLRRILGRAGDPVLAYGTDEDARMDGIGLDPDCVQFDLASNPVEYRVERAALANELLGKMEDKFETEGRSYHKLRLVFGRALGQYIGGLEEMARFIGGAYHRRMRVGDAAGKLPFEPVPAARQREALEFLKKYIFGAGALKFSPDLLNKLAPEYFATFSEGPYKTRIEYPLHDAIEKAQRSALDHLFDSTRLQRLLDMEDRYKKVEDRFSMSDLFTGVREAVWSELKAPANTNIGSFRRSLQRAHAKKLIAMLLDPPAGTPDDAVALARADLADVQAGVELALKSAAQMDRMTQAHLREMQSLIKNALEASIQRQVK